MYLLHNFQDNHMNTDFQMHRVGQKYIFAASCIFYKRIELRWVFLVSEFLQLLSENCVKAEAVSCEMILPSWSEVSMFSGIANEISCYRSGKLVRVLPSAGHLGSSLSTASMWMVLQLM